MKRIIAWLVIALVLFAGAAALSVKSGLVGKKISRAELQAGVQKVFPLQRGMVSLDLADPRVDCQPTEKRLSVSGELKVSALGLNASGQVKISGEPWFNPATQAVQIKELRIEQLDLSGLPEFAQGQIHKWVNQLADKFLADNPVYQLDQQRCWQKFLGSHVRAVTVSDDGVTLTLGF